MDIDENKSFLDIEPNWSDVDEFINMIEEYNDENEHDPLYYLDVGRLASMCWHICAAWLDGRDYDSMTRQSRISQLYSPGCGESSDDLAEDSFDEFAHALSRNAV